MRRSGALHHLELWMDDATSEDGPWPWLLSALGFRLESSWRTGRSWVLADAYVVLESGPDHVGGATDRRRSGLNHVAFWAGSRADVERLADEACRHGWALMFPDRHPFAGGERHCAAYLQDAAGFEVELVADDAQD